MESLVEDAFQESDPLSKEKELDRIRWGVAEELQGPDPLTVRAALAYAVKLSILAKWRALSPDAGRAVFDSLTQTPVHLASQTA